MSDGDLRKHLRKHFTAIGAFFCPIENSVQNGMPDAAVLHEGRTTWIECKASKAAMPVLRPEQITWHTQAVERCVRVVVVHRRLTEDGREDTCSVWLSVGGGLMKSLYVSDKNIRRWDWTGAKTGYGILPNILGR